MRQIELQELFSILAELEQQLQLEANQGIRKRELDQSVSALGGIEALGRLKRRIELNLTGQFWSEHPLPRVLRKKK